MLLRDKLKFWMALSNYVDMIVRGTSPLSLPDAIANSLSYVKAFGGTEQRNIPQPYTQVNYVTNTAQTAVDTGIMIDFAKNYEFEVECRAVSGSWYILQSRASSSGNITGIHGATSGSTITLVVGNVTVCTSAITRTVGHKLYVKATLNNGTATLYVKDETANTEDTQTGSYGTSQPNPTAAVYLLGNAGGQYADVNSDIYMARIKENDTVVMDYVPARQVATAGFYDKASKTFKTALTPANLSAGGDAVPTPDYPLDIVSNNGVLKYGVLGKNLFNVSANPLEQGGIASSDGQNTATSYNQRARTNGYIPVKPSTVYTASVKDLQIYYLEYAQDKTYTDRHATGFSDSSVTFTTGANTYFIRLQFRKSDNSNIQPSEVTNVQLERGSTATEYEPYQEGIYTDGTVETINVHGKNLFDKTQTPYQSGNYISSATVGQTGFSVTANANYNVYRIEVQPNTTYTFGKIKANAPYWVVADSSDEVLQTAQNGGGTEGVDITITTATSAKYLYLTVGVNGTYKCDDILQVELGSTATAYQPYYDGGTAIAEMLLKVDDYQDVQSILDGVVTRKVGVKVLDGTEEWRVSGNLFYADIATDALEDTHSCYCTHFKGVATNASASYNNEIKVGTNATQTVKWTRVQIYPVVGTYSDATAFKQYLADQYAAGTPVIIIYPLATPTTESVAGQTLQVQAGDNVLEITQASLNNLELESKYQKEA